MTARVYTSLPALLPRILVHEVPYWKREKSIRTVLWRPVFGIVVIAGQVRPWRQSSGTQNKIPSVLWTQPLESSSAVGMGRPERAFRGRWLFNRFLDAERTLWPPGKCQIRSNTELYGI